MIFTLEWQGLNSWETVLLKLGKWRLCVFKVKLTQQRPLFCLIRNRIRHWNVHSQVAWRRISWSLSVGGQLFEIIAYYGVQCIGVCSATLCDGLIKTFSQKVSQPITVTQVDALFTACIALAWFLEADRAAVSVFIGPCCPALLESYLRKCAYCCIIGQIKW